MVIRERKLLENTGWLLTLQAINILLPFVTVPYVTRVFGAEQYGVFSIALNWMSYFQLIIQYGFDLSATKKVVEAKNTDEYNKLVSAVVAARLLLVVLCLAISFGLALVGAAAGEQLACMTMLFSMLIGIALQLNWFFQGLQDMRVITIAAAIARLLSVALIFLLINSKEQLVLYSLLYSITFLLSGLITHIFAWRKYSVRIHIASFGSIMRELRDGMPIFLSSAAGNIISSVGVTVLGVSCSPAVVGAYAAVLKIPQVANLMFTPISQALYPRVNEERLKSNSAAVKLVIKIGIPITAIFFMGLSLMVVFRAPLVTLLFGEEYVITADALIPLALWVLLGIIDNFAGIQLLIPLGYQNMYSILMIVDCILSVLLNIIFGPLWGAMGVAWAMALSEVALTFGLTITLAVSVHDWHGRGPTKKGH